MKVQPVKSCERIDNIRSLKRKKEGRKMRRRRVREDRLVKTREELAGIRESGKVNKAVLGRSCRENWRRNVDRGN